MVQEAEEMRDADNLKKEGVTVKNDAETLCYQVEKQLSELKDKMSTADADDLKKKIKDLQEVSWKVTQQAYQQSSSEGGEENKESKFEEEKKDEKKEEKKEEKK